MLHVRSCLLMAVRQFFTDRGYCEVETPVLSSDIVVDAFLEPMEVQRGLGDRRMFLQTSPEAGMKRLLAAGSGSIFQVTRSFRGQESGTRHNPEFTMVEWYGVETTWRDQTELTEALVRHVREAACQYFAAGTIGDHGASPLEDKPFLLTAYNSAFERCLGASVLELPVDHLQALVAEQSSIGQDAFSTTDKDNLLNILLSEKIEPTMGSNHPEFLHNYPISQAALAERDPDDHRTALRFELYWQGLELCNGYQELTDPKELAARDQQQNKIRSTNNSAELPGANKMLAAMQSGLPQCSGVALGFDRLLMSILGVSDIRDVICFPFDSA